MIIGTFIPTDAGSTLSGTIDALLGYRRITFTPNSKGADYAVLTEAGCEVGAAWKRTSKDGSKESCR